MSTEKTISANYHSIEDVKGMISEINTLFGDIKNPNQIRVSGRWKFPLMGLDLEYNNKDCPGSCNTNCSGCSACNGCQGCDTTSTSSPKFDPNIFETPAFREFVAQVKTE